MSVDPSTPRQEGAKPSGFLANLLVSAVCIAAAAGFIAMALGLPAGHSRGDAGPAALPMQIGIFGLIVAGAYLILTLQGRMGQHDTEPGDLPRATAVLAIFAAALLAVSWIGLAPGIAVAGGLVTLLFPGEKRLPRAVVTTVGLWLIAFLLFQKLLGLPLP